jgi:hypothetical protein
MGEIHRSRVQSRGMRIETRLGTVGRGSVSGGDCDNPMSCRKIDPCAELVEYFRWFWGVQAGVCSLVRQFRRRGFRLVAIAVIAVAVLSSTRTVEAAPPGQPSDWQRFYYYPYIYYPHSFQKPQQYDHMYYRYEPSMRIPVYNKSWYNFYPTEKPYHSGHHFILDVF